MLISEEYRKLNKDLHETNISYGTSGHKWANTIRHLVQPWDTILDYGCGKRTLEMALGLQINNYDPCIPGLDTPPEPASLVICSDVLEHIEPDCLDAVLDDLKRVTLDKLFLVINTGPAVKFLADGRNAHLIQEDYKWWKPKITSRFNVEAINVLGKDIVIFCKKK